MKKLYTVTHAQEGFIITSAKYEEKPKTFKKHFETAAGKWSYGQRVVRKSQLNVITEYFYKQVITDDYKRIPEFISELAHKEIESNSRKIVSLESRSKEIVAHMDDAIFKAEKRIQEIENNEVE